MQDATSTSEQLCNAALEREASQRAAFLALACQGDDELRREVESLLAQEKPADGLGRAFPFVRTFAGGSKKQRQANEISLFDKTSNCSPTAFFLAVFPWG
jgi:hypothetical protein